MAQDMLTATSAPAPGAPQTISGHRNRRRHPINRTRIGLYCALIIAAAFTLLPFVWMLLGSLKSQGEILRNPQGWLPQDASLANYTTWFTELHFGGYFINSVVVATFTVLGNLIFCSMVGYALAKLRFPGKRALFVIVMATLMVPSVVTFVPAFVLLAKVHLIDTYPGLILPFLASPLGVFLMRQFMHSIPDSLIEAARIDGAGEMRIFSRIVMPLCGPPLATLGILTFLSSWNSLLWPLVVAQRQAMYTLPVALSLYSTGQRATEYGLLLAGSVLVIAPILLLYIALQRFFILGIATTGVK